MYSKQALRLKKMYLAHSGDHWYIIDDKVREYGVLNELEDIVGKWV